MTLEEYHIYSDITVKLFDFMNGRINSMNNQCTLYIDMWDTVHGTYGNIRYPNFIYIHVGTIVDTWNDEWSIYMNKRDYVGTCIAWAISHELHHADQLISMIRYNTNESYKKEMEGDVERASYDWVSNHKYEIEQVGGFNVVITGLYSPSLPDDGNYKRASVKEFYLQTIANTIIRDLELFVELKVFTNDNLASDIVLFFNDIDTVVIKSNGRYLAENVTKFSQLAFKWAGYYDIYNVCVDVSFSYSDDGRTIAIVKFNMSDQMIRPIVFGNKK